MKLLLLIPLLLVAIPAFAELPGMDTLASLIIKQFDRDRNAMIDINEWKNGVRDGFTEIDHDRDGFITESEIDTLVEPLSEEFTKFGAPAAVALIKKIIFVFDTDGDRRVSVAEYEESCANLFKTLDANHDGLITQAELADLPTKFLARVGQK